MFEKMRYALLAVSGFVAAITMMLSVAMAAELPKPKGWSAFQDPKLGATLYYPENWFEPKGLVDGAYIFASRHGDGKLILKSFLDGMRTGAAATITTFKDTPEAALISKIDSGDMWYELTGKNEAGLNRYTRVVYSCKERVVTEMTLLYPAAQAEAYAPVIEKMKRRFQSGVGVETPVRQCS